MKFRKANAKQTRGPNAKDLVLQSMEQPISKGKKACIHGGGGGEANVKKSNAPPKKTPRTKETKEKEVRENKRDAFLLFLTHDNDNENVKEQK